MGFFVTVVKKAASVQPVDFAIEACSVASSVLEPAYDHAGSLPGELTVLYHHYAVDRDVRDARRVAMGRFVCAGLRDRIGIKHD